MYLITGAAGAVGGVSRTVVDLLLAQGEQVRGMVHRDDIRAERLRELGAEVIVGDLTRPEDVVAAMDGVTRMVFNTSVSLDHLQATAVVCAAALDRGNLEVMVRGGDNGLWHIYEDTSGWSSWAALGGKLTSDVGLASNADGRLEVFYRGTDEAAWHLWQTAPNSGWSGHSSLGGKIQP